MYCIITLKHLRAQVTEELLHLTYLKACPRGKKKRKEKKVGR